MLLAGKAGGAKSNSVGGAIVAVLNNKINESVECRFDCGRIILEGILPLQVGSGSFGVLVL